MKINDTTTVTPKFEVKAVGLESTFDLSALRLAEAEQVEDGMINKAFPPVTSA